MSIADQDPHVPGTVPCIQLASLQRELADLRARLEALEGRFHGDVRALPDADGDQGGPSLLRSGDVWTLRRGRVSLQFKDSLGFRYLSLLVSQPHTPMHVLSMVSSGRGYVASNAFSLTVTQEQRSDTRAAVAYQAHAERLRSRLAEAEILGHPRASALRSELAALLSHMEKDRGLGGRSRTFATPGDRARSAVQRRIRNALRRVAAADAELGHYLGASIRTGLWCVFRPTDTTSVRRVFDVPASRGGGSSTELSVEGYGEWGPLLPQGPLALEEIL